MQGLLLADMRLFDTIVDDVPGRFLHLETSFVAPENCDWLRSDFQRWVIAGANAFCYFTARN